MKVLRCRDCGGPVEVAKFARLVSGWRYYCPACNWYWWTDRDLRK